jgi:predicted outer membrane protein
VTDHYLLDQYGKVGRKARTLVGPANKKIQPQVVSYKLQASGAKRQAIQPVVVWISLIKI